ncbi:MAG: hypothetical protein UT02_C0002G0041 [Parcubacteria group bacterium GW2011_GWC2_38_7]|nr:MAG: hypothetical protein UT02_C0002G0041 [Parcubacteria group bacterium GW2011_GWC2_38_7]
MAKFIPGLQLCELFYKEVVKALIETEFHNLKYSAALIGSGSEVLGFDTERSTDHHWGPRVLLFLAPKDFSKKKVISAFLSKKLPTSFLGFSTHFGNPNEIGVQLLSEAKAGQLINHRVEIHTIESFFKSYLSINPNDDLIASDWLTLSEQKLRTIRSGKIFYDQLGLKAFQEKLHYFPKDVWLYMLASEWMKISQEEPFVGRTGDVGDEIGSKIIAARLVQSIMKLCFLMEKEYATYSKWFGTAFSRLICSKKLSPILEKVLTAKNWKEREKYLSQAYKIIAQMHNNLKITKPLATDVSSFHDRPYLVIHGDVFANELKKKIKDSAVKKISADIGSVNQLSNTVDLLENDKLLKKLGILYR